jgi:hypothetical protein
MLTNLIDVDQTIKTLLSFSDEHVTHKNGSHKLIGMLNQRLFSISCTNWESELGRPPVISALDVFRMRRDPQRATGRRANIMRILRVVKPLYPRTTGGR